MTPTKLNGHDFEALLIDAAAKHEKAGLYTMSRAGVTMSHQNGQNIGVASKPDFEGVLIFPPGRQFLAEVKVNSESQFKMRPDKIKESQVIHLLKRSRFGSLSFLVIHWNERALVKSTDPAFTVAIPVLESDPRWHGFLTACRKWKADKKDDPAAKFEAPPALTRAESLQIGKVIPWRIPAGCRKPLPCILNILDPSGGFLSQFK